MEEIKVAAVVMRSAVGKPWENLARMEIFVRQAAFQGARVVCFPEMNITGYSLRQSMSSFAETIPGPSTEIVLKMAQDNGLLILAGLAERKSPGEVFISHFAAGPEGLLGVYRKLHLGPPEERIYQAGSELMVLHYGRIPFGIELCFDAHFPELSTLLALKGAEVIFIPHASPRESSREKRERWLRYLSARAYDNSLFVVACNQVGESESGLAFSGTALVLSPRGEIMAVKDEADEGIIYADLRETVLKEVRENHRGFFLRRRRPELYKELALS